LKLWDFIQDTQNQLFYGICSFTDILISTKMNSLMKMKLKIYIAMFIIFCWFKQYMWRHDSQRIKIQHNDIQHNKTQHNNKNTIFSTRTLHAVCYSHCHLKTLLFTILLLRLLSLRWMLYCWLSWSHVCTFIVILKAPYYISPQCQQVVYMLDMDNLQLRTFDHTFRRYCICKN